MSQIHPPLCERDSFVYWISIYFWLQSIMSAVFFTPYWLSSHCSIVYLLNWKKNNFSGSSPSPVPSRLKLYTIANYFSVFNSNCKMFYNKWSFHCQHTNTFYKCLICVIKYGSVESLIMSQWLEFYLEKWYRWYILVISIYLFL